MRTISPPHLPGKDKLYYYNGLDCALTREIFDAMPSHDDPEYRRMFSTLAPYLEMSLTGIKIDQQKMAKVKKTLTKELAHARTLLSILIEGCFGLKNFNPNSPKQVLRIFSEGFGERTKTTSKTFLAEQQRKTPIFCRLKQSNLKRLFIDLVSICRDKQKQISSLNFPQENSRWYYSMSVGTTSTGRLSSSSNAFFLGRNIQNIDGRFKSFVVADAGHELVEIDLEQADSRNVGAILHVLFNDASYLDACESGDLHTEVAKMLWPDKVADRESADLPYIGRHSYRFIAKQCGHATNYGGGPLGVARAVGIQTSVVRSFQQKYFAAFPPILRWHEWTKNQLRKSPPKITTFFGKSRVFLGRSNSPSTLRDALAYQGQSMTSHITDKMVLELFSRFPQAKLLFQKHDSVVFQLKDRSILPQIIPALSFSFPLPGSRSFSIPIEVLIGKNLGPYNEKDNTNRDGLRHYGVD